MTATWPADIAAGSGLGYSDNSNYGTWAYNAAPANYYDNVAAFYALYYRSGIVDYLNAARKLADRFWECPEVDRGQSYVLDPNALTLWPWRSTSTMGLVLRALDGRPEMWTGIEKIAWMANYDLSPGSYPGNVSPELWDVREVSYELATLAYCAAYDVNATPRATCQSELSTLMANFTARRFPDGSWRDFEGTYDLTTAVKLTNGSKAVDGSNSTNGCGATHSTAWTSGEFALQGDISTPIWFWGSPISPTALPTSNTATGADSTFYTPIWYSGTHLELDRAYAGPTGCYGWDIGYPYSVGYGAMPYMEGLLSEAFYFAGAALATSYPANSTVAYGYSVDAARWIMNRGYRSSTKSVYYMAGYVNCPLGSIPETGNWCTEDWDAWTARVISAEAVGGIARAYAYSKDASLKSFADLLYNAMWAKPATCPVGSAVCSPDGYYMLAFDNGQVDVSGTPPTAAAPKWFGQMWGYPGLSAWPAYRLGGQ
jgi:hypothetical protein